MKKSMVLCFVLFVALSSVYSKILTAFPYMGRPSWLRVNSGYIFISDNYSVSVYDLKTLKLINCLGRKGEGPGEFNSKPKVEFSDSQIVLNNPFKVILYSRDFKYLQEIKSNIFVDRLEVLENGYVISTPQVIDSKKFVIFSLYNAQLEKKIDLVKINEEQLTYKFLFFPYPTCRAWKNKVFIAQPHKGFYIDVFDSFGKKVYQIEKNIEKVRFEEKHRKLLMEDMYIFLGKERFERGKRRGVYKKPMTEFMPDINEFWAKDDKIYVKTYDITDTTEKFIVMDINGNQIKTSFLPISYRELLAFDKNIFYYLEENEDADAWVLHALEL